MKVCWMIDSHLLVTTKSSIFFSQPQEISTLVSLIHSKGYANRCSIA